MYVYMAFAMIFLCLHIDAISICRYKDVCNNISIPFDIYTFMHKYVHIHTYHIHYNFKYQK